MLKIAYRKQWELFTKSNGISRKKTSLKSKLNLNCGYHVPIISYASQTWYPNKAQLRQLERVQKQATSWITNNFKMSYTERLKFLKLLPLSIYFELHDILYLVSLLKNKHDIDSNKFIHKNESRTRQATRGEIAVYATRLKKSNENYYIRSKTLYNNFSQIVDFENQDYHSLKISITNTYWNFFNRSFAENNLCMSRILCWCGNCNPTGKNYKLIIEGSKPMEKS